ncbi:MAG: hypothetical protein HZA17_05875, partial [Nitrospirae bacterium]|nr:hypothetical protein [Nitrospirota bacterium]
MKKRMRIRIPLRYKLLAIIVIVLVSSGSFAAYHFYDMLKHEREEIQKANLRLSKEVADDIDEMISRSFSVLLALSRHPSVAAKDSQECDRLLSELLPAYPEYRNILVAGMDGKNYCTAIDPAGSRKLNFTDLQWFRQGSAGKHYVGDLHIS